MCIKKLEWLDPLHVAAQIPDDTGDYVLLYSGMSTAYTGKYSLLAMHKLDEVTGGFTELSNNLSSDNKTPFTNAWFGYLGYGLKNELEKLASDVPSFINNPDLWFVRFKFILLFNHIKKEVELWGEEGDGMLAINNILDKARSNKPVLSTNNEIPSVSIASNMSAREYLEKVNTIKEAIKRGDLYQANLTRKFYGEFNGNVRGFDIFYRLCKLSPAAYSAFIKFGDLYIVSSSPERFIYIDKNGIANTRPIKGSLARGNDAKQDLEAKYALQNSEKDRAENLMIVDLSRNDLAKNCVPGSVKVDELFSIESFATVHHMVSSISGVKTKDSTSIDLIKGCFPPGSMTGTPKIKAMQLCSGLEHLKRGIYSGAIGWFGGDGSADFSVVIRTIIIQGNKFEFQVGGAIVNDSDPQAEFIETMVKAKAVSAALGLDVSTLEEL